MSSMAEQIQNAIREDSGEGLAPGTDGGTPPQANETPPAGAQTTDTSQAGGPPEAIPYARFKEVNDRLSSLKGYEELAQYGYDPDSLGRLAAFEAQYMTDPIGTWKRLSDDLDLPQELKDMVDRLDIQSNPSAASAPEGGGTPSGESTPPGADLDPRVQKAIDFIERQEAAEAEKANEQVLDSVISHWDKLDKEVGLDTPLHIKLAMVSAAAAQGDFTSIEQLAENARKMVVDFRDQTLGSVVGSRRTGGQPLAVPGGGPGATPPQKFGNLREASKAAAADLQAGRLPTME
jgi:hypothetical protein